MSGIPARRAVQGRRCLKSPINAAGYGACKNRPVYIFHLRTSSEGRVCIDDVVHWLEKSRKPCNDREHEPHSSNYKALLECCMSHVACRTLHVACFMSHAACRMPHVACCTSHIAHRMPHVACRMPRVACCMSYVACRMCAACGMSHVAYRMSHAACFMSHVACRRSYHHDMGGHIAFCMRDIRAHHSAD